MMPEGFLSFPWGNRRPSPDRRGADRVDEDLQDRYMEYRQWQIDLLPRILPRECVRPLYRAALEWALERGIETGKDPLDLLRRFCSEVMPLPPLERWMEDYLRNPDAYREASGSSPHAPEAPVHPTMVAVRPVEIGDVTWTASLNVMEGDEGWRGFIGFSQLSGPSVRTANIFFEETPERVLERFESLEADTLFAFLRSSLP
jgi:hypothetical protein